MYGYFYNDLLHIYENQAHHNRDEIKNASKEKSLKF